MKKIILFIFFSGFLYAGSSSDVAFTTGYNKFDDPNYLRKGRFFFGVRGGVYQDDGYGFQLGYEHAHGANCQGLNLSRIYTNGLLISTSPTKVKPYGLLSTGYEMSNIHEHKPSQLFIGVGAGLRATLTPKINGFVETRVLKKLKSHDTDIITTFGIAYALDNSIAPVYTPQRRVYNTVTPQSTKSAVVSDRRLQQKPQRVVSYVEPYIEQPHRQTVITDTQKYYYVQLMALSRTNPQQYLQKLYARGIDNAQVKEINVRGRDMSLIVVGPFSDKKVAVRNLRRLKRVSRGAFIRKF